MNVNKPIRSSEPESFEEVADRLTRLYGGIVGGAALTRALGYPSQGAFRQALSRKRVPVPVFTLEGRRGRFAHAADIARWLWSQRIVDRHATHSAKKKEVKPMP